MARSANQHLTRIDWTALLIEFLGSPLTLEAFRKEKGIGGKGNFQKQTKGWQERKDRINAEAVHDAEQRIKAAKTKKWSSYTETIGALRAQVKKILADTVDPATGKITKKLDAAQLKSLASTLDLAIRSDSLIDGGPTSRVAASIESPHIQKFLHDLAGALREELAQRCPSCKADLKLRANVARILEDAAANVEKAQAVGG